MPSVNFVTANNDVKKNSEEFHNFDKATDRLDVVYFQSLCFEIGELIFTVSHGSSSVEHGFSVNNLILKKQYESRNHNCTSFHQGLYDCKWIISPHTFEKNNDLILSVKKARGRYQQELKEKSCKEKVVVCLMRSLLLQWYKLKKKNDLLYVHRGNTLKRSKVMKWKMASKFLTKHYNVYKKTQKNLTLVDLFHQQCFTEFDRKIVFFTELIYDFIGKSVVFIARHIIDWKSNTTFCYGP